MKKIVLSVLGATALLSTAAVAAPMNPAGIQPPEASNVDQVRLVCDEYGRCYRVRGPAIFSEVMAMTTAIMSVEAMATTAGAPGITVVAPVTVIMAAAQALGSVSGTAIGSKNIDPIRC